MECTPPRLAFQSRFVTFLLVAALGGCVGSPNAEPISMSNESFITRDVFFATTRVPSDDGQVFNGTHSDQTYFGIVQVGVPLAHQPGQLELANGVPEPERHWHTREIQTISTLQDFSQASTAGQPGAMIFVHGYNNSFIESVYRYAQIAHDTDLPAAAIQFSWASAGEPSAYLADRDRALISRYALAELIDAVSEEIPGRLVLVGHSMGSLPLMEALTLLDARTQARLAERLSEVVLVAPDLDIDLFAAQLERTALPAELFAVAVNRDDRLLGLSSFLSGGRERVGNKPDAASLSALGVRVLDISGVRDGDRPGHFLPATSPTLLEVFRTRAPS